MDFRPLAGTRIVDLSWNVAGPTVTRVLAALGAEVIKVEWPEMPDPGRTFSFSPVTEGVFDSGGYFADQNIGKSSFVANLSSEEGRGLVERLMCVSDVVVESYSPRVMRKWGWTWERLQEINPRLVYVSVSGFGHTGPDASYVSYGPTAQAASGITHTSGEAGKPPAGWGFSVLDVVTGYQGAYATVGAIHRQRRTGSGARVDLSQVEAGAAMLSPVLVDVLQGRALSGDNFPPGNRAQIPGGSAPGYRFETGAPYNMYPTDDGGPDAFCAITVLDDLQWQSLVEVMGRPEWALDPEFSSMSGRVAAQGEIDLQMAKWTQGHGKYELADLLQAAGIPAGAMQSGRDRLEKDPSLRARGIFQALDHEVVGTNRYQGLPIRVDGEALPLRAEWPILGQDTERLLSEALDMDQAEIDELLAAGHLWPPGRTRPSYAKGARDVHA